MAGERVTTARIESLLALATPGPWCRAYHAGWEVEAAPNQRLADCGTIGAAASDALLMSAARDLGADLLDARAQVATLTAERDAALARIAALEAEVARLSEADNDVALIISPEPWTCCDCGRLNLPDIEWCPVCSPEKFPRGFARKET